MPDPLSIQFGPWSPDTADQPTPVAQSVMQAPLADCSNVFYADGNYQSLPGLVPSAATPLTQNCVGAYTWYSASELQDIIAAGTTNTLNLLKQDVWEVGTIEVTTFEVTIVVGSYAGGGGGGVDLGYNQAVAGSISKNTDFNGNLITQMVQLNNGQFLLQFSTANLGATYFTSLYCAELGITLKATDATYGGSGGITDYGWPSPGLALVNGATYTFTLISAGTVGTPRWAFMALGEYLIAVPQADAFRAGPYLHTFSGDVNTFVRPGNAPGGSIGGIIGQFLMVGDIDQAQNVYLITGDGTQTHYNGILPTPLGDIVIVNASAGDGSIEFDQTGSALPFGIITGGTLDFQTGDITLFFTALAFGDVLIASSTSVAPSRVVWSAIGDPTNFPIPFTDAAIAAQSSLEDLDTELGPVTFIAGFPLYGLIFQAHGITRAQYVGGDVVFSFAPYERSHGCITPGGACQVGANVYFLADDGFWMTDGANVTPIGTAQDNSAGIDNWFWEQLLGDAESALTGTLLQIRSGYDAEKRCVCWAIPTGLSPPNLNNQPDTLLMYNILSGRWTKAPLLCETIWTSHDPLSGEPSTRRTLGVFDQAHLPNTLSGATTAGYLETSDLYFPDGMTRYCTGARPIIACTDTPTARMGARNSMKEAVRYTADWQPDKFSKVCPVFSQGTFQRVRVTSGAALSITGVLLQFETGGSV